MPQFSASKEIEVPLIFEKVGIEVGVYAGIGPIQSKIVDGVISARAEATARATIAVRVGDGEWHSMNVVAGLVQVDSVVVLHISSDTTLGYVTFKPDHNSIHFSFDLHLPFPFNYVTKAILELLSLLSSEVAEKIVSAYKSLKIVLIDVGDSVPVFGVPFDYSIKTFEPVGDEVQILVTAQASDDNLT